MKVSTIVQREALGELPCDWILFRYPRKTVPVQRDGAYLTYHSVHAQLPVLLQLANTPHLQIFDVLNGPCLMKPEMLTGAFVLGTGWVFSEGNKMAGQALSVGPSFKEKIRYLKFLQSNRVHVVLSHNFLPGKVAYAHVQELDGWHNLIEYGLVDVETRKCTILTSDVNRRSCEACVLLTEECFCDGTSLTRAFSPNRSQRMKWLSEGGGLAGCGKAYIKSWLQGTWIANMGLNAAVRIQSQYLLHGSEVDRALLSVVQKELLSLFTPRFNTKLIKCASPEGRSAAVESGSNELDVHREVATKEKSSCICDVCGSRFARPANLRRHINTVHNRAREHVCDTCGKRFAQSGHLNEHMRAIHSGVSVLQCSLCNKAFGVKSKLERHVQTVHEKVKLFSCELCGKKCGEKSNLKKHMRQHEGVRANTECSPESTSHN